MLASRPLVSRMLTQSVRRYHEHGSFRMPSMDELPVPRGPWQARHDANQRKYNAMLAFGVVFAITSVATAKASGLVYFNWSPPKSID